MINNKLIKDYKVNNILIQYKVIPCYAHISKS